MLFLSDAVFAIVLTLLVLDLRVPPGASDANPFPAILAMEPRLVAFAVCLPLSLMGVRRASVYLSFVLAPLALILARLLIAGRPRRLAPKVAQTGSDVPAGD